MHQRPYRHTPVPLRKLPHRLAALEARQTRAKLAADLYTRTARARRRPFSSFTLFFLSFLGGRRRPLRFQRSAASSAQPCNHRRKRANLNSPPYIPRRVRTKRLTLGLPLIIFCSCSRCRVPVTEQQWPRGRREASTHGTPFSGEEAVSHHAFPVKCGRSHRGGTTAKAALLQLEFRTSSVASLL